MQRPQQKFHDAWCKCLYTLEQYKLKTNFVGCNINQTQVNYFCKLYTQKIHVRLNQIQQKINSLSQIAKKNIKYCQAAELRVLNNCLRNYRKRVGQLNFEPSKFTYAKFDKEQENLFEIIVANDISQTQKIQNIKSQIQECIKTYSFDFESNKQFQIQPNKNHIENVIKLIDQSQIKAFKQYEYFERSVFLMVNQLHDCFDKFSKYLNAWEQLSSNAAFQVKTKQQLDLQMKIALKKNQYYQEETIQSLTLALARCPAYSPMRQQYIKRIQEIKRIQYQKQKRRDRAGNMSNKRRSKRGILKHQYRNVNIVNWYVNYNHQKVDLPQRKTKSKLKPIQVDEYDHQYRRHDLEPKQKIIKTAQQILQHTYTSSGLNSYFWHDNSHMLVPITQNIMIQPPSKLSLFQLLNFPLSIIQKRIQYQNERQIELQQQDQKKKRDVTAQERQFYHQDQNKHSNLCIGYKFLNQDQQLQYYLSTNYDDSFLPVTPYQKWIEQKKFQRIVPDKKEQIIKSQIQKKQELLLLRESNNQGKQQLFSWIQPKPIVQEYKQIFQQQIISNQQNKSILRKIIESFFIQFQRKQKRRQNLVSARLTKYIYEQGQLKLDKLLNLAQYQKIFLVNQQLLINIEKIKTYHLEGKVKCLLLGNFPQEIKFYQEKLKDIYPNDIVTIRNILIQQLDSDDFFSFQIGLILSLSKQNALYDLFGQSHINNVYQMNSDQIEEYRIIGQQLYQDFRQFFNEPRQID